MAKASSKHTPFASKTRGTGIVDSRVAEIFLAQFEVMNAHDEPACLMAAKRRRRLIRQLSERQRGYLALIGEVVMRHARA